MSMNVPLVHMNVTSMLTVQIWRVRSIVLAMMDSLEMGSSAVREFLFIFNDFFIVHSH